MSFRSTKEVPMFIKASSPEGLRRKMEQNNARMGIANHYFDIQFANGVWYSWFYVDNMKKFNIKENDNDISKK
jgi:hypothetical protein